ncbi:EAL domain-containing protein [Agrobacterium sp. a22-2]|uniref:sensor domain-containing protein n=1 Tax=Agrobacterium sp. a22-2 TaxID=2283840 RepID=UPI001447A23D|nr:EAL domain-containing protein [Agrobacterium sp. a22-2]NKN36521.1 EAL domain-containing protein [Agrobacterium sp. a22-2]
MRAPEPAEAHDHAAARFGWLFDYLPLPAAVLRHDGGLEAVNPLFCDLCGRGEWHLLGTSLADLVHPDDRPIFQAMLTSAMPAARKTGQLELRLVDTKGRDRWVMASIGVLDQGTGGSLPSLIVQFTDVSAHKAEMANLAEAESRWNFALVCSASGVWDHRLDNGQMYYSEIWRKIRGLEPGDPYPPTTEEWLELVHPDDRVGVLHSIERQNAGDPDYTTFEYRERHKDGRWIWIECRGACVEWDAEGRPARIIGTDTDITGRKVSEEMLARMSRRLKLALEVSRVGVFETDFDAGTSNWDEGMLAIFGLDRQCSEKTVEIGGVWEAMLHPDDAQRLFERVDYHVQNLLPFSDEYRIILDDGSERYIRSRTMPFIDSDGHRKMIGANWDVTADLALHRELERAKNLAEARTCELEITKAHIEHIALHDHLTDLPNRRYLDEMLDRLAQDCAGQGGGIAVLHIDLDRFKQINDTLGHNAGDMMLKHASKVLKANIRDGDFVARIGGDEFVFIARFDGSMRKLSNLADRIIDKMRRPVTYESHECRIGASIGIAFSNGPQTDARQLLLNADIALYHAKNRGRNRHEFFSRDSHSQMVTTKRVSDEILRGLEFDEFTPFYQFQFDARTLDIVGVETLARWRHPTRGILTPDKFLSIADDLDVVAIIDGVILDKALVDFGKWRAKGLAIPKLSVNVSSRRLHDPALKKALSALVMEPGTVSFELLESTFLDEYDDQVVENLAHLQQMGIDIEIDDFGTGHASIVSLLRLNPRTLKIDRQLIQSITTSHEQRKLVGSIIDIGHSLNIRVIAEGVETPEHAQVLLELGCDTLQGFGLARPMAYRDIQAFIAAQSWRKGMLDPTLRH